MPIIALLAFLWVVFVIIVLAALSGWLINILYAVFLLTGMFIRRSRRTWIVLREEIARPVRVIRKALSRKKDILLDEYERHLS
jgi:hypothetical protein